jgi:hypothetical protein
MQCSLPHLAVKLDDPRLDGDATETEEPARVLLPTTVVPIAKKQGNDFRTATSRVESAGRSRLAPLTQDRSTANLVGVPAGFPYGHLNLLEEGLGPQTFGPGPATAHASGTYMKLVALICCHQQTILVRSDPRKSRNTSIDENRSYAHAIV